MVEVEQVLEWRDAEFAEIDKEAGLAAGATTPGRPGVWLPFDRQKALQHEHERKWFKAKENEWKVETVSKRHEGVKNKMTRDLRSMYRSDCFEKMGGTDWLFVLIAIGTLDDLILQCMHEAGVDGWFAMPWQDHGKVCHGHGKTCHGHGKFCHGHGKICHGHDKICHGHGKICHGHGRPLP